MAKNAKKVYCSAGLNHVVIMPNGDAFRCQADFMRSPPLFNVKDGWKPLSEPLPCAYDSCDSSCERDWTTRWIMDNCADEPCIISARDKFFASFDKAFFCKGGARHVPEKIAHILWFPTFKCNYKCKYCGCVNENDWHHYDKFSCLNPDLSCDEWMAAWSHIYNAYDSGIITVVGGEPLLSKATLPVLAMMSDKFLITITTNISIDINVMGIVRNGIRPAGKTGIVSITGSLHPTAKNFNKDFFFGSLLYLKKHGYNVGVTLVGYPLQLFLADEYKEYCEKHGINFTLSAWMGGDDDGFCAHYLKEEKNFFNNFSSEKKENDLIGFKQYQYKIETAQNTKIQISRDSTAYLRGIIFNTGDSSWDNSGLSEDVSFKVGAQIERFGTERSIIKELRVPLPKDEILPGESFDFEIAIATEGIPPGAYWLRLDMVKENAFWFEQWDNDTLRLKLVVT